MGFGCLMLTGNDIKQLDVALHCDLVNISGSVQE